MKTIDFAAHAKRRLQLIEQLESGQLDKVQFIELNTQLYNDYIIELPSTISSLEEGLFYYQYYNTMAKYYQIKYKYLLDENIFDAIEMRNQSSAYYRDKENITKLIISREYNEPITAYYVDVNSQRLKNKLVEIIFLERDKVILHTLDKQVIKILKRKKYFKYNKLKSRIEMYINQPY